jgi:phage gp46-like protein
MVRLMLLGMWLFLLPHPSRAAELITGSGDELVRGHCSGCHSLQLVTAQRGDRAYWLKTIRWMQQTQNLWTLPAAQETVILDYLAEHYAESEWGRRPNLSPLLRPMAGK